MDEKTKFIRKKLLDIQEKAWLSFQYHKESLHRLLYWYSGFVVTVTFSIVLAARIMSLRGSPQEDLQDKCEDQTITETSTNTRLELVEAFEYLVADPGFVIILVLISLGLFALLLHHHLSSKFYLQVLKCVSKVKYDRISEYNPFSKVRSPYYLYVGIFKHKKSLSIFKGNVSSFGIVGLFLYLCAVILLFSYLVYNSIEHHAPNNLIVVSLIAFLLMFGAVAILWAIFENKRKLFNTILDRRFDVLNHYLEKELSDTQ